MFKSRKSVKFRKHPVSALRSSFNGEMFDKKCPLSPLERCPTERESSVTEKQVKFGGDQICCPPECPLRVEVVTAEYPATLLKSLLEKDCLRGTQ